MQTLLITDNSSTLQIASDLASTYGEIAIFQSPGGNFPGVLQINVKKEISLIVREYDLILSLHCKQIFPRELVENVRCVNIHPGYNPYNRGWFPHVFSIINSEKAGVTIHEMDAKLDHGEIIVQKECQINSWDTSETVYSRLLEIERELLFEYYPDIRDGSYSVTMPNNHEGTINYKKDYEKLKRFDLDEVATMQTFINRLRALTHSEYKNAYFINEDGEKVFMKLTLERDL